MYTPRGVQQYQYLLRGTVNLPTSALLRVIIHVHILGVQGHRLV